MGTLNLQREGPEQITVHELELADKEDALRVLLHQLRVNVHVFRHLHSFAKWTSCKPIIPLH